MRTFAEFLHGYIWVNKRLGHPSTMPSRRAIYWNGWPRRTSLTRRSRCRRAWFCGSSRTWRPSTTPCGANRSGLRVKTFWILDAVRHFGAEPACTWPSSRFPGATHGAIAFGIGGDEARGPARMVSRRLRLRARRRTAPGVSRRRDHGPRIHLGGARNRRGTHRPRHRGGTRSGADGEAPRIEHPARSLHFEQRVHGRGGIAGRASGAHALRCRRADRAQYRRSVVLPTPRSRANTSWRETCSVCRWRNWRPTVFATPSAWGNRLPNWKPIST